MSVGQDSTMNYDTANVNKTYLYIMYVKRKTPVHSPVSLQRSDFQNWVPKKDFSHFWAVSTDLRCATLENCFQCQLPDGWHVLWLGDLSRVDLHDNALPTWKTTTEWNAASDLRHIFHHSSFLSEQIYILTSSNKSFFWFTAGETVE